MLSTLLVHSKESVLIDFPTITSLYFGCYMIKVDIMYYMILYIRVCTGMFCSGSGQSRKSTIRTQLLPVCIFRPDLSPLTVCFHNSRGFFFFFLVNNLSAYTITSLPHNHPPPWQCECISKQWSLFSAHILVGNIILLLFNLLLYCFLSVKTAMNYNLTTTKLCQLGEDRRNTKFRALIAMRDWIIWDI